MSPFPARALIADDERLMREQLRARLAEVWPELEIVGEARNGLEAVKMTESLHPHIVFLDIRMPGLTGVDAARQIAQLATHEEAADQWPGCEIVFITAYDQYAVEAFEQGVVDYVLKPAERERLALTVERVRKRLDLRRRAASASADGAPDTAADLATAGDAPAPVAMQQLLHRLAAKLNPDAPPALRWIQASVGQSIQMIPVEDVLFFISDEKYTRVQTATLEALIRKPIKELVDELDPDLFWQIHRSTLVNTRFIAGVSRDLRGRQLVAVKGRPEKLEVSRSFTGLFKGM
ncbi:MAG: LytTR family DNA-binding domain-containing protein [Burkholderiaceae bacterium]